MKSGEKKQGNANPQVLKICGLEKEKIDKALSDIFKKQKDVVMDLRQEDGEFHLYLKAKNSDAKDARKLLKPLVREVKHRIGKHIYATEVEKTLTMAVVELLIARKLTLSCAESCTGGLLSAGIISIPGASDVFLEGFVTYTDKAKRRRLLVKKSTLKQETAVSAKTAKEMAKGGCFTSGSDVCVSVTGYAGPDGGTKEKPVGTVFIGCCVKGDVVVREYHFRGDRSQIRTLAVTNALALLRECLLGDAK